MEEDLKKNLEVELENQRVVSLGKLEGVLEGVLNKIQTEDKRTERKQEREKRIRIQEAVSAASPVSINENSTSTTTTEPQSTSEQLEVATTSTSESPSISNDSTLNTGSFGASLNQQTMDVKETSFINDMATPDVEKIDLVKSLEYFNQDQSIIQPETPSLSQRATENTENLQKPTPIIESAKEVSSSASKTEINDQQQQTQQDSEKQAKQKVNKFSGFHINFVSIPPNEEGKSIRSHIAGESIHINTMHPDFVVRMKSKYGKPKFTERLFAYLAAIISSHYHDERYKLSGLDPSREKIYDDLIGTTNRIETALRRKLPQLQKSVNEVMPQEIVQSLQDEDDEEDF
eukprot:TRINITY_DN4947_c0_g1_i1.p1 TRINITY_DN4947_c0_g1~~TRINITY_DN4947_c0_g1_i1.p1  ORF type:complete len:346 (+),score=84.00 TRINITY_DN4947_c0_g1_i1:1139-2176(+)